MDMRLVYDSARGRLVMWGGRLQFGSFVWEYVNGQWVQRTISGHVPAGRQAHTMAFDARNGNTVLFAGFDDVRRYGETWLYGAVPLASASAFGGRCGPGAGLELEPGQRPWLGDTLTFRTTAAAGPAWLLLGSSTAVWQGMALPLDLTPAGMPGCALHTGPEVMLGMTADATGATAHLPLPTQLALLGSVFYAQALVADAAAAAGAGATNALELRVGGR
jgi:hypothetical protein